MHRFERRRNGASVPVPRWGRKVMILGDERVAYAGLLGAPSLRSFGCYTLYSSLASPLRVHAGGAPLETAGLVVVPPWLPHRVETTDRMIGTLSIESESVARDCLPRWLSGPGAAVVEGAVAGRVRDSFLRLVRGDYGMDLTGVDIDLLFLGRLLERRELDPRVAGVVDEIRRRPHGHLSAQEAADAAGLSFSRFLHVFRAEVGAPFRGFRAWKRARSFLNHANGSDSLTELALEIGYPDSSHFSHSIRQVYGLRPSDIFAGSRDLAIVQQNAERVTAP